MTREERSQRYFRKVQDLAGHSVGVVIPKEICKDLGIGKGDYVKVALVGQQLHITKEEE